MRQPEFWWRDTFAARLAAAALAPLGMAYGASVAWKHRTRSPYHSHVPVICVGNLTVGGSGKTPVAIGVARLLQERGESPVFLSRGYGRKDASALMVDIQSHDAAAVGDEALLLARVTPTIVSHDRATGARIAEAQGASVIIMDDGHQNFSLSVSFTYIRVWGLPFLMLTQLLSSFFISIGRSRVLIGGAGTGADVRGYRPGRRRR